MKHSDQWKPTASIDVLKKRARFLHNIRTFFIHRNVTEVETPILSHFAGTEPAIKAITANFSISGKQCQGYLQSSPEYAMKRLLAAGMGDCFQMTKAFRDEESGRYHNPEFSILEWYRTGFDDLRLLQDVDDFLQQILACEKAEYYSYQQLFLNFLEIDPITADLQDLRECAEKFMHHPPQMLVVEDYLKMLFSFCIEPKIAQQRPCFVTGYPSSQASLARISETNPELSCRFEVFFKGIELGNGFYELSDAKQQLKRFQDENLQRQDMGLPIMNIDHRFIGALDQGFPDCAGIAMGIDRLLMIAVNATDISQVLAFPIDRA